MPKLGIVRATYNMSRSKPWHAGSNLEAANIKYPVRRLPANLIHVTLSLNYKFF